VKKTHPKKTPFSTRPCSYTSRTSLRTSEEAISLLRKYGAMTREEVLDVLADAWIPPSMYQKGPE